jgi:Neuraminidase (sialidase)
VKRLFLGTAVLVSLTFCSAARATLEPHNVAKGTEPCIVSNESKLHASMLGHQNGSTIGDVFYSQSDDGGSSWTSPTNVSKTPGTCTHPEMAVDKNGSINIVWGDTRAGAKGHDIFFARSQDGGKTWTEAHLEKN